MSEFVKQTKAKRGNPNWGNGKSGNPNGRPKNPEAEELREALALAAKKNNKSFLEHFVMRAYKNDTVAIALAKKLIPDKIEGNITGDVLVEFIRGNRLLSRTEATTVSSK